MKRGIDKAVAAVVAHIKQNAEIVGDNYDKIEQVATVSANNDPEIGKLLADAMRKVSKDGVITIEESKSRDTNIGVTEGMQFDRGYLSAYFVTDSEKMECVRTTRTSLSTTRRSVALRTSCLSFSRLQRADARCSSSLRTLTLRHSPHSL